MTCFCSQCCTDLMLRTEYRRGVTEPRYPVPAKIYHVRQEPPVGKFWPRALSLMELRNEWVLRVLWSMGDERGTEYDRVTTSTR